MCGVGLSSRKHRCSTAALAASIVAVLGRLMNLRRGIKWSLWALMMRRGRGSMAMGSSLIGQTRRREGHALIDDLIMAWHFAGIGGAGEELVGGRAECGRYGGDLKAMFVVAVDDVHEPLVGKRVALLVFPTRQLTQNG